jgi:hypothetical protein
MGRRGDTERGGRDMANIRSFRDLKVWQKAMEVAMDVFRQSNACPACERYSLTDQVRRR